MKRMKIKIYIYKFDLNSVYSLWLCKECGGKCVQDVSLLISNNMNTVTQKKVDIICRLGKNDL